MTMMTPLRRILTLIFALASLTSSLPAQTDWSTAKERLSELRTWDELCAVEDCDQFPDGYATWSIGSDLYYFPTFETLNTQPPSIYALRYGRFEDRGPDGEGIRFFGYSGGSFRIDRCCHELLTFFGLADDVPSAFARANGRVMPQATIRVQRVDSRSSLGRYSDNSPLGPPIPAAQTPPRLSDIVSADQLSYNADFWILGFFNMRHSNDRGIELLSKRPLLSGRHVFASCAGSECDYTTVSFAKDAESQAPYVALEGSYVGKEPLWTCEPEAIREGCDPSHENFQYVPQLLGAIDRMLEATKVKPGG